MATFADLEAEVKTIADAFTSINHYHYGERNSINFADRTKTYPALLFDSKRVSFTNKRVSRNGLPIVKEYNCTLFLMDDYNNAEKASKELADKEAELVAIGDQFWAEFRTRTKSTSRGLLITEFSGLAASVRDSQHNNKVVEIEYNFTIEITNEVCTLGTFNY